MASMIDFAALDLRGAFDFAIMIEEDAQVRYERLSRSIGEDPGGAGDVFRMMVTQERKHRSDLVTRRAAIFGEAPPRIEISVLDEGVEAPDVEMDELPAGAREALEVSLAAERRAHEFFEKAIPCVRDPEVRAFFEGLMQEEAEHGRLLAEQIAALGDGDGGRGRAQTFRHGPRMGSAEAYPDRAALQAVLPRFDAATQAVAAGVIVDGMDEGEVAAGLGVSRRTVARKLARFLCVARQHVAAALTATTLAGCAGSLPQEVSAARSAEQEIVRPVLARAEVSTATAVEATPRSPPAAAAEADGNERSALADRIRAQVAKRMPRHGRALHARLARAILAEAELAGLDPLLVLALIHVESSFDPLAVSSAGAVGLMQLVGPTLRRELARSGLGARDPHDPVTNVQAGVRYLRRLLDAFGHMDVALMAYNAGPNRIRGHLRRGEIPKRFLVYPRKVNGELERLRSALGTAAPVPSQVAAAETAGPRPRG
jgi:soluble lytic murein transglycosylase-like protein/rubrerythrin